jgi:hypothetical protein
MTLARSSLLGAIVATGIFCPSLLCCHCSDALVEMGQWPVSTVTYGTLLQCLFIVVTSAKIVVCIFWKEHKEENKCLKCGKAMYVEVINDDGEMVTTKVAHK